MSAAEQVQMEMVHRLPAIVARVHDDPITMVQLLFARDLGRRGHQMAHQRRVFGQRFRRRANVLLRDNQKVCGRLGINVGKSDAAFVFIHAVGWYGAGDDLAKKAIGRRGRRGRFQICFHIKNILDAVHRPMGCKPRRRPHDRRWRDGSRSKSPRRDAVPDRPARSRRVAGTHAVS